MISFFTWKTIRLQISEAPNMAGMVAQSHVNGATDTGWESMSLDPKSFQFKLSTRTHMNLSGLLYLAPRLWHTGFWLPCLTPNSGILSSSPLMYSLFQRDIGIAVTCCGSLLQERLHFAHISSWNVSPSPLLRKACFPRFSSSVHFSEKPINLFWAKQICGFGPSLTGHFHMLVSNSSVSRLFNKTLLQRWGLFLFLPGLPKTILVPNLVLP